MKAVRYVYRYRCLNKRHRVHNYGASSADKAIERVKEINAEKPDEMTPFRQTCGAWVAERRLEQPWEEIS